MKPRLIGEARTFPKLDVETPVVGRRPLSLSTDAFSAAGEGTPVRDTTIVARGDVQPITGMRAFRMATGLEFGLKSYVPPSQFRALSRVRTERARVKGDTDEQLAARFLYLKRSVESGTTTIDRVKEKSLAIASEIASRTLGLDPYDVQILAALELLDGAVAELGTGEGKTLVGALVGATRALDGLGVHVLTANPYLARRDAERLRPLYEGLGLTLGVSEGTMDAHDKRDAYGADVTYAYATQVVWDWLDDQTWYRKSFQKMRPLAHCVIDEIDHVLGDAATEPIVLTGEAEADDSYEERQRLARMARDIVDQLEPSTDLEIYQERKRGRAHLTDRGLAHLDEIVNKALGRDTDETVWETENVPLLFEILKIVETRHEIILDRDFIKDGEQIILLDPNTDRPNPSACLRFNKLDSVYMRDEIGAPAAQETVGFITNQHFFPMYKSIGGMTATGSKMKEEFGDIYGMRVSKIPPHRKSIRTDEPDRYFPHAAFRTMTALADVIATTRNGQPVLVATHDVAESEFISARLAAPHLCIADVVASSDRLLRAALVQLDAGDSILSRIAELTTEWERKSLVDEIGHLIANDASGAESVTKMLDDLGLPATKLLERGSIGHRVLNAKTLYQEEEIVSAAGELGAVTVGTPMALIGTDITYGDGVAAVGGLRIVAIGHMDNERKDDQLRGRTARQGLPGTTAFYVAPEDDVFTYGSASTMRSLCERLLDEQAPESTGHRRAWRSAITSAQERNETDQQYRRRAITRFDGAIQHQRKSYTAERNAILATDNLTEHLACLVRDRAQRTLLKGLAPELDVDSMTEASVQDEVQYYEGHDFKVHADLAKSVLETVPGGPVLDEDMRVDHILGALEIRLDAHLALSTHTQRERATRSQIMSPDNPYDPELNQWLRERILEVQDSHWVGYLQDRDSARSLATLKAFGESDIFTAFIKESAIAFAGTQRAMKAEVVDEVTDLIARMQDPLVERLGLVALGRSKATDRSKREAASMILARAEWKPEAIDKNVMCLDAIDILARTDDGAKAIVRAFDAERGAGGNIAGYAVKRLEGHGQNEAADAIRARFDGKLPSSRSYVLSRAIFWQFDPQKKIAALEHIAQSGDKSWIPDLKSWIPGQADQTLDVDRAVKRTLDTLEGRNRQRAPQPARRRRHRGTDSSRNAS